MKSYYAKVSDIIEGRAESPLPIEVIPNNMGINLFMGETRNTLTEVKERLSAVERLASDTAKRLDALESKERERR